MPINFFNHQSQEESELTDNKSITSTQTARQDQTPEDIHNTMSTDESTAVLGNTLQRYGQQLTNALSKFKITDDLEDGNYSSWNRSMFDNLETLELHHYVKINNYIDKEISTDKGLKTKKIIVSYILNRLDKVNHSQAINHLTDPDDPNSIIYDPFSLWSYLRERHFLINASRLATITKTLSNITTSKGDTISTYLDKFEDLFVEFTRYGAKMDDIQSAIRLIDSIECLPESTVEFIHSTISPLNRRDVNKYLREYDMRHNF